MTTDAGTTWRVGELAEQAGTTVRALHHYDAVGLLRAERTPTGHRVYGPDHVARLYRIAALRRLGLSLDEIDGILAAPDERLADALSRHLQIARQRAHTATRLAERLADLATHLAADDDPPAGDLLAVLEDMFMLDPITHGTTSLLVYDDLPAAHAYLVEVFGLTPGPLEHHDGKAVHGEVRCGDHVIWLHPPGDGFRSPAELGGVTGMTVVEVDDVDAHHRNSVGAGADILSEPVNQAYGVREYGARDPQGQRWYFHSPLT